MEMLYRTADIDEIRRIIEKNIQLLEQETQTDSGNIHREVEEVKRYINTHYGEEISIEMLAERVFLAPSYLSTIFKKEIRPEFKQIYQDLPNGKSTRDAGGHEGQNREHQRKGRISECFLFLSELSGVLWDDAAEISRSRRECRTR